jgi:hypothetical protein
MEHKTLGADLTDDALDGAVYGIISDLQATINDAGSLLDRLPSQFRDAQTRSLMGYFGLLREALEIPGFSSIIPGSFLTVCNATLRYLIDQIKLKNLTSRFSESRSYHAARDTKEAVIRTVEGLDEWVTSVSTYLSESDRGTEDSEERNAVLSGWMRISEAFAVQLDLRERLRERIERGSETAESRLQASNEGAMRLGREFQLHARLETMESYSWAIIAIMSLVGASLIAAFWLLRNTNLQVTQEIARLAATLPLIGLAGYASRISNQHRENARWSRRSAVRLETITDYSRGLSDEDGRELRKSLGTQVFTTDVALAVSRETVSPNDDIARLIDQISHVLQPYQTKTRPAPKRISRRTPNAATIREDQQVGQSANGQGS